MHTENNNTAVPAPRTPRRKAGPSRRYRVMIAYRFLLAIFGGYALAALVAMVTSLGFPEQQASATLSGTLLAFCVHTGVFIWVFMVQSTRKATLGVLIPAIIFAVAYWLLKK
ncbi:MAG: hypothetical protein AAGC78_10115 [Cellvibrio sp.]|uniref:hypothetical protein n=1 Tax=Cellvibrio sp. TaxID=1965322 RepID=UPI0031A2719C